MATPRFGIEEIATGQDNITPHNNGLKRIEIVLQTAVIDKDLTAPPGGEADGDMYIVGASATGAWATHDGALAYYRSATWSFYPASGSPGAAHEGLTAWVKDENTHYTWDGAAWVNVGGSVASSRQIISGAGLTGGGDLSADRTLAVGPGTGILANADDVAIDKASDANVRAAASNKVLTSDLIESASAFVALTDAANIALDWDAGINRALTIGGNRTLDNPTNGQPGTWRTVVITQDGTGSRTLAYGNQYKFPGGTEPVLTTAAGSVDVLNILCVTASNFYVFSANDLKA